MTLRRELGWMLAALATAAAAGCAPMASTPGPTAASPPATAAPGQPAAGGAHATALPAVEPAAAGVDTTTPSADAQRVLARIPEPLTPAQQALNASRTRATVAAPTATYDSLQAAPVPAPTQPLATETSTMTMMDTTGETPPGSTAGGGSAATGAAAGAAPTGAASAAGAAPPAVGTAAGASAASAGSGPCWRLQVGAPLESEKEKADARLEAAQSLLMASFTIVPEKGYLKVRTSDCMTREAADALKKRAVDSGFTDAFLVDTNATPPAKATATKHQQVPASKRKK
jgi:hypothetical protein